MLRHLLLWISFLLPLSGIAQAPSSAGEVRVPLDAYQQMLDQLRDQPTHAPAPYAIGKSEVIVEVNDEGERTTATVKIKVTVETFDKQWTAVPILPHGAALSSVLVNGKPVQLVHSAEWLAWTTNTMGTAQIELTYGVDATRSESGYVLSVPIPRAATTQLNANFRASGLDVAVVPSANLKTRSIDSATIVNAAIPATSSILISWRSPAKKSHTMSRALYEGSLESHAINWNAEFDVQVFAGESVSVRLMPSSVTLSDVRVDDKAATVMDEGGYFAVLLQGRGNHRVKVSFLVPVVQQQGPPQATLLIPRVPVSRFTLKLPGRKEVTVSPHSNVVAKIDDKATSATVFLPMNDKVTFSWMDEVPEELKAKVRANANLYHLFHAEEGVLHGHAAIVYEITHGETNSMSFLVPADAQINRISAPGGGVSDWTVETQEAKKSKRIRVFLDRAVKGDFTIDVFYEKLFNPKQTENEPIVVPLLEAQDMHRQRGMIALLSGPELTLQPVTETGVSKVGENQLPAVIKNQISMTVAHTFKYSGDGVALAVKSVAPERRQGKFDAQVDTLISLGEVTLKGSAAVQIDVKAGTIMDLTLGLPLNINVLNVAGPSIRSHEVISQAQQQQIKIAFTQEMEGQFRLEVNYEKILGEGKEDLSTPTVSVYEAEVEHGRIAVEALTAAEVKVAVAEQLSTIDVNELPQQLVLKTTNPILLSFKYVHAEPPFRLGLKVTRHNELDVQVAAIESAQYQTLITDDGLAVTTARYQVRNSRRQFLRLNLPVGSNIWSVFVNNQAEKPATATEGAPANNAILVKMINSSQGFPIEVVYASQIAKMNMFGTVSAVLPRPDIIVTQTRWDVFLPGHFRYYDIDSNMSMASPAQAIDERQSDQLAALGKQATHSQQAGQPLRVYVPTQGVHMSFEKLYANQSEGDTWIKLKYSSGAGNQLGVWLSVLGVVMVWVGVFALRRKDVARSAEIATAGVGGGLLCLLVAIAYLQTSATLSAGLMLIGGALYAAQLIWPRIRRFVETKRSQRMASDDLGEHKEPDPRQPG